MSLRSSRLHISETIAPVVAGLVPAIHVFDEVGSG